MTTTLIKHIINKWIFFPRQKERRTKQQDVKTFQTYKANKKWVACVKGYYPIGPFCCEVYFNLYEDENSNRFYEEYRGREFNHIPRKADFSVKAQVDAWLNSKAPLQHTIMKENFYNLLAEGDLAPQIATHLNIDKSKLH